MVSPPFPAELWSLLQPRHLICHLTISSRFITAKAWKQDGTRGKWCAGFDQTWVVPTTYDAKAEDWYSFPFLIQDGETQQTDMKVLSAKTTLQLVGTGPVELFYDPRMETKGIHTNENILGFDDDLTSKVTANTPGMTVHGPHTITSPKHEGDDIAMMAGPPSPFAVGAAAPVKPAVTITRARSGNGLTAGESCSDVIEVQNSTLAGLARSDPHAFGNLETVTGVRAERHLAWFIQGLKPVDARMSTFPISASRAQPSDNTEDFGWR